MCIRDSVDTTSDEFHERLEVKLDQVTDNMVGDSVDKDKILSNCDNLSETIVLKDSTVY